MVSSPLETFRLPRSWEQKGRRLKSVNQGGIRTENATTFELTIQVDARPVKLRGDVDADSPQDTRDGGGGGARLEDDGVAHLLVQRGLCEDK